MKRLLIYVLPILVIVLGAWLFVSRQAPISKVSPVQAAPIYTTVNNEPGNVNYLSPVYDVYIKRGIVYATKKNETEAEEPLKFDLYEPEGDNNKMRPVFIFIHGGGFKEGTRTDAEQFSKELAKRGYAVLSMDYRLKSDPFADFTHTVFDAFEDISDVIGWINNNATAYGLDAAHLAIGGDSAGGQLAMNFANEYLDLNPASVKPIFAIIDIYGGLLMNSAHENLPPVLIIHGTIDKLIPYQQSLQLNDLLEKSGIYHTLFTLDGVGHDYKNAKYFDEIVENTSHFLWNIMSRPKTEWLPERVGIEAVAGDAFDIQLPEGFRNPVNGQIKVNLPNEWSLGKNEDTQSLRVQVPVGLNRGNHSIFVSLDQSQQPEPRFAMNVKVVDPVKESFDSYWDATDHKIKTHLQITNASKSEFNGSLQVTYETEQSNQGTFSIRVDQLEPGKSKTFTIPELAKGKRTLKGFNASGTLLQITEDSSPALLVHKIQKRITIDGNLDEWQDQVSFEVNGVAINDWKGKEDASAVGYLSWDANYLYVAVDVTDDVHSQPADSSMIWNGDSIQLGIGFANADGSVPLEYHEMGVALNDNGNLTNWRWIAPKSFSTDGSVNIHEAVKRQGQKTIYELAIPWSELTPDTALITQGTKLKFSMVVNDNDGSGRKGWLEYNSGIATAKDINEFGDLYLMD
ncbi:alpha/beta hydrolase fold domain-containing protein [Paenibacillus planticolens]|uniref:Alpha/beta hydrolase fold domain-containing protein n=1 Tax=Paenibacillus planticolens TaxID=2654976 RepID=A0ABX1ZST8_9BACL|nr:alpha/beta hydrolase fold domain-containing protein [Paenibacillus planticolens]NOV01909.1 alpha/beta hydrolase fold domain-containing protein [Paenibacillus planticolens]